MEQFSEELTIQGPRVPLTKDPALLSAGGGAGGGPDQAAYLRRAVHGRRRRCGVTARVCALHAVGGRDGRRLP